MEAGHLAPQQERRRGPVVWLADPFNFTLWYTTALAQSLAETGTHVRLLCGNFSREPGYLAASGLHPDPGPMHLTTPHVPRMLQRVLRTSEIVLNTTSLALQLRAGIHRPQILHLQQLPLLNHGIHTDFLLIDAAQHVGVPVVHTVHNVLPHDSGEELREIYSRLYGTVDHLICHSEAAALRLQTEFGVGTERLSVIPHGPLFAATRPPSQADVVLAKRGLQIEPDRTVVLWQGVLAPYKGVDVLLRAWSLLLLGWRSRYGREPLLLIAGDGPAQMKQEIERHTQEVGSSVRTCFGYIPSSDLPNYYRAADVLVYPYRAITTSGALITGLSYCRPIVASNLPCFREYLVNGRNALLTEPGDPYELAAALGLLMHDREDSRDDGDHLHARLMAGAAANRTLYASWHEIALRTRALYLELLSRKITRNCA